MVALGIQYKKGLLLDKKALAGNVKSSLNSSLYKLKYTIDHGT